MSMAFAREVMALELDPEHKHFAKVLSIKQAVASSILVATARVNSGSLRPSGDDGLADILARVKRGVPPGEISGLESSVEDHGLMAAEREAALALLD